MSDSIVLWRMCIVWDRARSVCAFAAAVLVTTAVLNIANIAVLQGTLLSPDFKLPKDFVNSWSVTTYGGTSVGLAAAFLSLASNLCATMLVGLKAWYAIHTLAFVYSF